MDWETIGFVKASVHRLAILTRLDDRESTPKELQSFADVHFSQVSLVLKELIKHGLVECLNEESRKGKIYALTDTGKEVIKQIKGEGK